MDDAQLADEIIARLNKLIEDPEVREVVGRLIEEARVTCPQSVLDHPSIVAVEFDPAKHTTRVKPGHQAPAGWVGFLGVLNGLVGTRADKPGWGYIAAYYEDDAPNTLVRFQRST